MMLLRANVLTLGFSGIRRDVIELLCEMLNRRVHPVVPEKGSVGASGDLAPLAHLALSVIGEGEVFFEGQRMASAEALQRAKLKPLELEAKEGLALLNGTQAMHAVGGLALLRAQRLARVADVSGAMSLEALKGTPVAFDLRLQDARPHPGQKAVAEHLLSLMEDSEIRQSHLTDDPRVQDAYSLRCMPQVHGAVRGALAHCEDILLIESASATDNPLVFAETGDVISGGNFHGAPLAFAFDYAAIAMTDLMSMSERRTDRLTNPDKSEGLPAFLARRPGVESGFMIAHVAAASLVNEARVLAHPASIDNITTSGGKEDHVSMGMTSALKLRSIVDLAENLLAIELLAAAEGLEHRRPLKAGRGVERAFAAVRKIAPPLTHDRPLSGDIARVAEAIRRGDFDREERTDMSGKRIIHAPRGSERTCKGWHQEAAMRMLMNNLDPDVAENPDQLVVYGGTGRAARSWEAFDAIVGSLRELENDETLLVQSGKPVGKFRTHDEAPRVLIANSNLVGQWNNYAEFNRLERMGLTMYGQMTAGSWIYIGSQGIVQGTFETFAAAGRKHFGGSLDGKFVLTGGLGGMGGAQPLAATMNGAVFLGVEVDPARIEKRLKSGYCDKIAWSLDEALKLIDQARKDRKSLSVGLVGNCADVLPEIVKRGVVPDVLTDQTSAHDALNGYVPHGMSLEDALALRRKNPDEYIERAMHSMAVHVEAMLALQKKGAITFDYGNNIRAQAQKAGVKNAFDIPGFRS